MLETLNADLTLKIPHYAGEVEEGSPLDLATACPEVAFPTEVAARSIEDSSVLTSLGKPIEHPPGAVEVVKRQAEKTATRECGWSILGLEDAFQDCERPPWVIEGLVMTETVTLVSAHPHAMKSLSWLYASLEGVMTKKVFGHFPAPDLDNVLFIETEDPEWLVKKRIQGFAKGLRLKEGSRIPGFRFTCPGPFDLAVQVGMLEGLINEHNLDLIILSTLQNTLEGRDWKEQKQMAEVMAKLVIIARLCPIVVLTHSPQDLRQKRAAGTITIGANCATHIHYEKAVDHKAGDTFVNLTVDSKAGATETQFALRLLRDPKDGDEVSSVRGLVYAGTGTRGRLNKKKAVHDVLQESPNASSEEIAKEVGCSERYVQMIRGEEKDGDGKRDVNTR
jgi:hypothetical protein